MVPTMESGRMEKKIIDPFAHLHNHAPSRTSQHPQPEEMKTQTPKKKKKRGVREANKTRHSNNRSKRCEIWKLLPTDHMENAVKCRKYLSDWLLKLRMREEFKGRSMQQCISFNVRVTQ